MFHDDLPPRSVCLLRLSAIGDCCHVVPLLRALQLAWPATRFTWVIGRTEARLMQCIPGVEFIEVDKHAGLAGLRALRRQLRHRRFDLLLNLQHSVRASAVSLCIRADRRLGFARADSRELHWLLNDAQVPPTGNVHVADSLLAFADALGVAARSLERSLPLPEEARARARQLIPDWHPTLVISPCSSHALRNWSAVRYAAVADHAVERWGMNVLLCGGRSATERAMADAILAHARRDITDLTGRDTLPELQAVLERATVLLSPDSGPVHMATLARTPVIGLYAATRLARSGPHNATQWSVDAYDEAARRFLGRTARQIPWRRKIEFPGVMDLISVEQVTRQLGRLARHAHGQPVAERAA